MEKFTTFWIGIFLIFWQQQTCIANSSPLHLGINSNPLDVADSILIKIRNKNDFSEIHALREKKNFLFYFYGNAELSPSIDRSQAFFENLMGAEELLKKNFDTITSYDKKNPSSFGNYILYKKIPQIVLGGMRNIEVIKYALIDSEDSLVNSVNSYSIGGFEKNCVTYLSYHQSIQQYYRYVVEYMKFVEVRTLLMMKMALEIVPKYPPGIIESIEELNPNFVNEKSQKCPSKNDDKKYKECLFQFYSKSLAISANEVPEKVRKIDREVAETMKLKMKTASRELWRCDYLQKENESFVKLDYLFRGYFSSSDENKKCPSKGTCQHPTPCTGNMRSCKSLKLSRGLFRYNNYLKMCIPNPTSPSPKRRYTYAEYAYEHNPKSYGTKGSCQFNIEMTKPTEYCICEEYLNPDSDQYVSLQPVMARENHIVTGARIIKWNHTLYIQIFEGILGPEATVSSRTDSVIKTIEPTESNIENKLIHKIQWDSGKGVYLTKNSLVPKGFVLVGLGFGVTKDKVLHLVTYVKNSDYQTGKLISDVIAYHHIPNADEVKALDIDDLDVPPEKSDKKSVSKSGDYLLRFTTSSLTRDIGQTTIPYIDIQYVSSTVPAPMSDAGLYYKAVPYHAGYLGLKLYTYDIEPYFSV